MEQYLEETIINKSLDKIIKKSLKNIENNYKHVSPKIMSSFYYGEYKNSPNLLSILYIFDKETDCDKAKSKKLTDEIECATVNELINNGYSKYAFKPKNDFFTEDDKVSDGLLTAIEFFADEMNRRCVNISFTSNEEIQNKADGNIFLFLQ